MDEFIGLFYREQTSEVKQIINKLLAEEDRIFYQSRHLFLTSQTEFLCNENFYSNDKTILFFSGQCFNKKQLIEKSGLDSNVSFA